MIQDLLDASKIRAGQGLTVKMMDMELISVVKTMIDEMSTVHGPRFELKAPPKLKGYWSPDNLQRALENLLMNAIKYGSDLHQITISIETENNLVKLYIHNWGAHIPEGDLKTLFDLYKRTDEAEKTNAKAWGLGLTLVKGVIEAHGGTISVESSASNGTTFKMIFPRDSRMPITSS